MPPGPSSIAISRATSSPRIRSASAKSRRSRAAFRGDYGDQSLLIGLISAALLAVVGLAIANRTFQRESA